MIDSIRRMAKASTNVIVRGESGTGKELVARALHDQGRAAAGLSSASIAPLCPKA